jgi:predicted branched-subunit amino acid permease
MTMVNNRAFFMSLMIATTVADLRRPKLLLGHTDSTMRLFLVRKKNTSVTSR